MTDTAPEPAPEPASPALAALPAPRPGPIATLFGLSSLVSPGTYALAGFGLFYAVAAWTILRSGLTMVGVWW